MFDFGDELTIQSYGIPWLIWIQLLILFLIIVFLYCCSSIAFEFSDGCVTASPSGGGLFAAARSDVDKQLRNSTAGTITSSHHSKAAGGSQNRRSGERTTRTSRRIARGEDIVESDTPSGDKGVSGISWSEPSYHPCYYIRLARQVFLKCLGLDSLSDDSPNPERRSRSDT